MNISVQTGDVVVDFGYEKGAKMIREAGFEAIDWNIDHALNVAKLKNAPVLKDICIFEKSLDEVLAYFDYQIKAFRDNGLKITQAHAPFPAYFPGREDALDYCIGIYNRCIELCDTVGCKNLVVHGITMSPEDRSATPEYYRDLNLRLYRGLMDTLKHTNVTVCLENLFRDYGRDFVEGVCSDPHEAVEMIDLLNEESGKECFGLCLDTGHLNLLRKRFPNYVPLLGKRIKALHIHDNDATGDQHMMPYAGTIIWNDFIASMRQIGYDGDLNFETFNQTRTSRLDPELVPLFLHTICEIGIFFRKKILE